MQLQDVELLASPNAEAVLKLCAVKLVDIGKIHVLNLNISEENLPTEGESDMFDGDQETLRARLKMISVKLVDCKKAKAEFEQEYGAYAHDYNSCDFMTSNKSNRFDEDQQTLHAQLKLGLVRLVDCRKVQSTQAAEVEPEDGAHDHESNNHASSRFPGAQQTLHAQLKMSSVKLVDCGKIQGKNSAAVGELEGKSSRFDGDQQTLEAQLKVCLVRLVDCGKIPGSKPAAKGEPGDKFSYENVLFSRETNPSSVHQVEERSTKNVAFGESSHASHLSGKRVAQSVYRRSRCGKSFSSSFDFRTPQNAPTEEKPYNCTRCGKEFSQRSQLRRHQRVHTGAKPYYMCKK